MPTPLNKTSTAAANVQVVRLGDTLSISVIGRFDFQCHRDFRRSHERVEGIRQVVIDLERTDTMRPGGSTRGRAGVTANRRQWAERQISRR